MAGNNDTNTVTPVEIVKDPYTQEIIGVVPSTGTNDEDTVKEVLLKASDLVETYTWNKIQNTDVVTSIVFTSAQVDAYYGQTVTLTRTMTYNNVKPPTLATVTDTLTIV